MGRGLALGMGATRAGSRLMAGKGDWSDRGSGWRYGKGWRWGWELELGYCRGH